MIERDSIITKNMMMVGFEPTTLYRLAPRTSALTTRPHHLVIMYTFSELFFLKINTQNAIYNPNMHIILLVSRIRTDITT